MEAGTLHSTLVAYGIPVDTVRSTGGVWSVAYGPTATPEQQTQGDALVAQLVSRETDYLAAIAAGYAVEPEGFTLAIGEADLLEWTKLSNLTREALDLGLITDETEQTILDQTFTPRVVTTLRLRQILVALGLYYKQVWTTYRS